MKFYRSNFVQGLVVSIVAAAAALAGPDGIDVFSVTNTRIDHVFVTATDDALCIKARNFDSETQDADPGRDNRNITTSNAVVYQVNYRGTKFGTETAAALFEDILYENIFIARAGANMANTIYLADSAEVRNVVYRNFYATGSTWAADITPFGRPIWPSARIHQITLRNFVGNVVRFSGNEASDFLVSDSVVTNFWRQGSITTDKNHLTFNSYVDVDSMTLDANPVYALDFAFPIESSRHMRPDLLYIEAEVRHDGGLPLTVEFFADGVSIGTATSAPYAIEWDAPDGWHNLTFTVTDAHGNSDALATPRRVEVRSAPVFTAIRIFPGNPEIGPELDKPFTARALDQYGETFYPQPTAWTWSADSGGSFADPASGVLTAGGTDGGPHTVRVSATIDGVTVEGTTTFTITSELNITDMFVASGKDYVWDTLAAGALRYIDRTVTFSSVGDYGGKLYLRNANDDKNRAGTMVSFRVNLPVTVWIAVANDFDRNTPWLADYTSTGTTLNGFEVFSRFFEPGMIALGDNGGAANMYHIVLDYTPPPPPPPGPALAEIINPEAIHTTISEESHLFALRANGEPVDVHFMVAMSDPARTDWGHMHYAHISARGVLDLEVDLLDGTTLNWIRPRAFMVQPTQVGNTVSFRLHHPHYYILEAHHNGLDHALVLFVDELPANAPLPTDPNVLTSTAAGIVPGAGREANQAAYNAARDQIRSNPNLDILYIEPGHYHFAPNMRTGIGVWVAAGAYIDSGQVFSDWQEGFFLRGRGAVGNGATFFADGSIDLRRPNAHGQMFLLRQARNFLLEGLISRFSQDWNIALRLVDDVEVRNWKVLNTLDWVNNDGLDTERARRVLFEQHYVSAGADNSSDKANAKSATLAFGFERDVQDITRRDGVFYSMAKAQKFGTESDADYMERFLFENMFSVRATGGPQSHLADRATLRDFTARNWHVDSGSRLIEMNVAPWGRYPTTANLRDMRFENIFAHSNGDVSFGTFSETTPIQDVELSNIWQNGQFATSTASMSLGTWAKVETFTVSVDPAIWAAHDRFGRVGEPVPMNAYFVDEAGNWSSDQGPGTYSVTWSVQSGPATVTFSNAKDPQTTATFSQRGEYVLRLMADNHPTVYDELTVTVLDPAFAGEPVARFIAFPTLPQMQHPVTFDASFSNDPDGSIVSYTWDFGDGTTLTTASPTASHTFTAAGIHEVYLTVTDNDGNSRRIRDWIVVRALERTPFGGVAHTVPGRIQMEHFDDGSPGIAFFDRSAGAVDPDDPYKPDPSAYRAPPDFIEEYFNIRFPDIRATADPETPGGHELYDINNPSSPTPEFVSYTLNVTQTGTYEMRIRVNPDQASVDRLFNVYINDQLVAENRSWGRRTTYGLTTVPNIPLNQTGEQVLKVEFLGSLGSNGGINYFDLVRTSAPVPSAAFTISPTSGEAPLSVTVDASASHGGGEALVRYDWNFGDGTILADANAIETHTYVADGNYTITLTVTNLSANTDSTVLSYFVGLEPPPPANPPRAFMFNFGDSPYDGNSSPAHADGTVPLSFTDWQTMNAATVTQTITIDGTDYSVAAEFRRADGTGTDAAVNLAQTSRTGNRPGTGSGIFGTALTQSWRSYQNSGAPGRSVGAFFTGLAPGEYDVYAVVHNPVLIAAGRTTNVGIGVGSATSGSMAWNHADLTGTSLPANPRTDAWEPGVNYAKVRVTVTAENPNIYVIQGGPAAANDEFDYHTLTAVQIVAVLPDEPEPTDLYADWAADNNITGGATDLTGGVPNLIRYALGGDANTPMSTLLPQIQSEADPGGLTLSLTFHRIDDPLITYAVWYSDDLADWGVAPIWQATGAHEGAPGMFEVSLDVSADRGFLRLEVSRGE